MKNTTQIILVLSIIFSFMLGLYIGGLVMKDEIEKRELIKSAKKLKTDEKQSNINSNKHPQ